LNYNPSADLGSQAAALSSATHTYHSAAAAQISTLSQVTESLVEVGTREDKPTGNTPRKKTWKYQDEWELTKSRDVVLEEWRQRGVSTKDTETFLAEHLPLPGDEEAATDEGDAVMREADEAEVEEEVLTRSVVSSISSSSTAASVTIQQKCLSPPPIPAPPIPVPVLKPVHKRTSSIPSKSGLPTMGTLTERPTNIFGGRRRIR
jgi:kinesin family protein 11